MKPIGLVLALLAASISWGAQPVPGLVGLRARLDKLAGALDGRLGYSLKILDTGQQISYRGDERFPSASTIKSAVMVEAINQVEEGKVKWTDKRSIPSDPSLREASMWTYFMKEGTKLDLDGYVNLMIGVSDNTATILTRDWMGTMNVNARMEALGLKNTKILGNAPKDRTDIQRLRRMFGMGMTTPNEMNRLFELIATGKAASSAGCEKMVRILGKQYWDDFIGATVPPKYKVCCKSGAINRSRSDVAIVYGPMTYILSIYTDSQKDQRWTSENQGDRTIRAIGMEVWNTLFPKEKYTLPKGSELFAPTGGGVE